MTTTPDTTGKPEAQHRHTITAKMGDHSMRIEIDDMLLSRIGADITPVSRSVEQVAIGVASQYFRRMAERLDPEMVKSTETYKQMERSQKYYEGQCHELEKRLSGAFIMPGRQS